MGAIGPRSARQPPGGGTPGVSTRKRGSLNKGKKMNGAEFVCSDCFGDSGLRTFVGNNAEAKKCDFCGTEAEIPFAADLETVSEFFRECIEREYDDAGNHLGYESAEGGYQGRHWNNYDLISDAIELDLPNDRDDKLFGRLVDSLPDRAWCEVNPFSLNPWELARFSWEEFCR